MNASKNIIITLSLIIISLSTFAAESLNLKSVKMYNAEVVNTNNQAVLLKDITSAEKTTIFAFFAEWCAPCQKELDSLNANLDSLNAAGVEVVAVALGSKGKMDKINITIKEKGWKMKFLYDSENEGQNIYRITTLPYVMVVNKTGKIVYDNNGFSAEKFAFLKLVINEVK
jgi:peroxiredoxin